MKAYGGVEASTLDGGGWVSFTSLGGRGPGTHWIGGWVGPTADLDAVEKKEISCLCSGSNPDFMIFQPIA
jgi:hypothetical protein